MKPRRPPTAILLLFLAAIAAWLTLRLRPDAQTPAGTVPANQEVRNTPALPAPRTSIPAPSTPESTPLVGSLPPSPAPVVPRSSPTPGAPTPHAEPFVASDALNPAARSESASINAIRVRRMVTDYHTLTGENPVGTNAEIMAAVMGKNPRQAVLGPPEGLALNPQGELIDEWGTPYFFHQLSRDVMEIHSAGPDKIMGTADDVVVR
ncbi:MAG: hypothetical protein INR62_02880 [Rhodospirillales bacterium]|nr:hypothetical protein [Acetobacter sp.]